jgi:hypothetical protein
MHCRRRPPPLPLALSHLLPPLVLAVALAAPHPGADYEAVSCVRAPLICRE